MDIQQSIQRIGEQKSILADLFYLVFMERYPGIRHYFEGMDPKAQELLLAKALGVIGRHYQGSDHATTTYLQYLGPKLRAQGILRRELWKFRAATLATLERFHCKNWTARLAHQWREAIDKAMVAMQAPSQHHAWPSGQPSSGSRTARYLAAARNRASRSRA